MSTLMGAAIGMLAGLHAATWGMYKDAPHEGFSVLKYLRSPLLGTFLGAIVQQLSALNPTRSADALILFGVVYVVERALGEIYKTFLRNEDQSKYFIPMQLHMFGEVVRSRTARLTAGTLYAGTLLGMVACLYQYDSGTEAKPHLLVLLLIGSLGGWISAFGGAWKDAPLEGFQILKFFRSPALAAMFAYAAFGLTDSLLLVTLAATGYTIATTETYKTFFFPSKPRGKFAGKPVNYPDMLLTRQRAVLPYVAVWAALVLVALKAFHG
jgi:hypothetical protein